MIKRELAKIRTDEVFNSVELMILDEADVRTIAHFIDLELIKLRWIVRETGSFSGIADAFYQLQQCVQNVFGNTIGTRNELPIVEEIWPGDTAVVNLFARRHIPLSFVATASIEDLQKIPQVGSRIAARIHARQALVKEKLDSIT